MTQNQIQPSTIGEPVPGAVRPAVAIVGAGPAGLMAAEYLSAHGVAVTVYDRMASPARKFLMAGRGGLNLTHAEDFAAFLSRYEGDAAWLEPYLSAFGPQDLRGWADGLGAETFVGSSGRVFPKVMKASPLLRGWLGRLAAQGVVLRTGHHWCDRDATGVLHFATGAGDVAVRADATLLALGGASWPKLGTDGCWADILKSQGVLVHPFRPSNCGFRVGWSEAFGAYAGEPLKNVGLHIGGRAVRGEAMVATYGLEGGGIYALSRTLRETIAAEGFAVLTVDLRPDISVAELAVRLAAGKKGQSVANILRKTVRLSPVAVNLMREGLLQQTGSVHLPNQPDALAALIKAVPLRLVAPMPLERAISSAGGIDKAELDAGLQLRKIPGVYVAGEMIDWEAPTGGYLLTACFATGMAAAQAILRQLGVSDGAAG